MYVMQGFDDLPAGPAWDSCFRKFASKWGKIPIFAVNSSQEWTLIQELEKL